MIICRLSKGFIDIEIRMMNAIVQVSCASVRLANMVAYCCKAASTVSTHTSQRVEHAICIKKKMQKYNQIGSTFTVDVDYTILIKAQSFIRVRYSRPSTVRLCLVSTEIAVKI